MKGSQDGVTPPSACGLQEGATSSGKGPKNPLGPNCKKVPRSPEPELPRGLGLAGGRPPPGLSGGSLDDLGSIPATPRLLPITSLRSRRPSSEDGALTSHFGTLCTLHALLLDFKHACKCTSLQQACS